MRLHEITDLEEGWKSTLAGIGTSAALALSPSQTSVTKPPKQAVSHAKHTVDTKGATPEVILKQTAIQAGINGVELAQFMAQCAHETGGFKDLVERGGTKWFNRYEPHHNPKLAKILGNTKPGDGVKFNGRGFLQVTGKDNYARAEKALGIPLTTTPELLTDLKVAAEVSVWYWKTRVAPKVTNFKNTAQVTYPINSKLVGLPDRIAKFNDYMKEIHASL